MEYLTPIKQNKLFGLNKFFNELIYLYKKNNLPNKILLSGQKGIGKSTLAYHFINYVLSENEEFCYNLDNFEINIENRSYKLTCNNTNPNITVIDINPEKKFIDINQIRELILNLNKSSFNNKPRFVLIDNIDLLNINSVNALLKILEEPSLNVYFILINNNKKILKTLLSRCINFKIFITNNESLQISEKLIGNNLDKIINPDLINYYMSPGNIYNFIKFAELNKQKLLDLNLKDLLRTIITENYYKKDDLMKYLFFDLIEFYLRRINSSFSLKIYDKYNYFVKKISDTRKFNLDEESLFIEFHEELLNE